MHVINILIEKEVLYSSAAFNGEALEMIKVRGIIQKMDCYILSPRNPFFQSQLSSSARSKRDKHALVA